MNHVLHQHDRQTTAIMADVVLESDNAMSRGLSKIHKRDNPKIPGRKIEARQISPLGNSLVAPFERKKAKK